MTIEQALQAYLRMLQQARSANTYLTYRNAMKLFVHVLHTKGIDIHTQEIKTFPEEAIIWFSNYLKHLSPTSEQVYITAAAGFFEFLVAENLFAANLPRVRLLIRQRSRSSGTRLPQFSRDKIEEIIEYAIIVANSTSSQDERERLIDLRDSAFILTLADTGLRVHEACALRRGDMHWYEAKAIIIGKGNRQAVVRFSKRSLESIKRYLALRQALDGSSRKPLASLPIFARHDKGSGKKVLPITPTTGRNIITRRVQECLGDEFAGTITPHSFRHYFVTRVLLGSGGNLKLAQELARHRSISVTQRYAHLAEDELDKSYWEIFEES